MAALDITTKIGPLEKESSGLRHNKQPTVATTLGYWGARGRVEFGRIDTELALRALNGLGGGR